MRRLGLRTIYDVRLHPLQDAEVKVDEVHWRPQERKDGSGGVLSTA